MTEESSYKGVWFLPENPDHQVVGTLHYELNQHPYLDLTGILVERSNKSHEPDFILGFTTDGKRITLYRSYESERSHSMPGMQISQYKPLYILKGAHFTLSEDFKFKVIKGRFRNLESWVGISGFEQTETNNNNNETVVRYKRPEAINFSVCEGVTGSINFTYSYPFGRPLHKAKIEQHVEIHLEFMLSLPLLDVMEKLMLFQNFLTLATFQIANPLSIVAVVEHQGESQVEDSNDPNFNDDFGEDKKYTRCEVFYKPGFHIPLEKQSSRHNFLFSFKDVQEDFQKIITQWVGLNDAIEPVLDLLLDSFYREEGVTENKFLNVIHGLETFHRRRRKNEILPRDEHAKKISMIIDLVPEDTKSWLKEVLNFTNEPPLHHRLVELMDEVWGSLLMQIIKDKDHFIRDTKNSRNYYTHYDPRGEKKALKGAELTYLTQRLRFILIMLILKETGLEAATVERVVGRRVAFFRHLFNKDEFSG
ncbi:MAG: hypothetical protein JNL60_11485 [Bacteroidia bacterium]|nr:hypothetical protein [Bacteroidia bacterium]